MYYVYLLLLNYTYNAIFAMDVWNDKVGRRLKLVSDDT
jgi:hypothetical protein